ncbi:hypothetical protein B0T11DRAFT_290698 [Plectosphaerella cucumerina]|uniref:Major facilitator superfamily (MFS) profile domain-containing protein n=1 Tax=Plectosphaerella cucumerina TaxID=40658 RepID=A0A8K0TCV3_9PEZI|nr:hypothetical protein B0T11DRAFT_290698 [Plectosphaerella cucumerina]
MAVDSPETKRAEARTVGVELASVLPDDGLPWYKRPHLLRLNFCILSLCLFSGSNGFDGSLLGGLLALPDWHSFMEYPEGAWLGFINAIYMLGAASAYPLAAWMCNKYGRKPGIWVGQGFMLLGTGLQAGAPNAIAFLMSRLLVGLSCGFMLSVPMLIAESAYPTQRGIASSLYNCGWYGGSVIAAWSTFGCRNLPNNLGWRIPSALQVALPLLAMPGFLMIDESPRWLVSMDRVDEARRNLTKIHGGGDASSPLIAFEIAEIEATLKAEKEAQNSTSWADLWSSPGNRHRLFISVSLGIFCQWVGNGVVSYYLVMVLASVGITSVTDQTLISACLQLWNLIWACSAAAMVDRLGRRFLFLSSGTIMLVSYIIITGLSGSFASTAHSPTGLAVIPFLFIYFAGYDIALTPLAVSYPIEIWPFQLRARGLSVSLLTSLVAVFFNIFINPIALGAIQWKYYFVFIAVLIGMLVSVWFWYPETRGFTLETVGEIFDGPSAAVHTTAKDALREASAHFEGAHEDEKDIREEK